MSDQDLMLEILKQLQADLSSVKKDVGELKEGQIRIREDVHSLSGHVLSLERTQHAFDNRLQRIEKRLDLVDA